MSADDAPEPVGRLDEIVTQWSLLRLSHEDSVTMAGPARNALVLRYSGAIRKYIGAMMRDDSDADEVAQDVVVRMLKGDFAAADPARGRFRDLLKTAVRNMVRTYWSRKQRRTGAGLDVELLGEADDGGEASTGEWDQTWQRSVLDMTWKALEDYERSAAGSVAYQVLRLRSDHPDDDSEQLAQRLSSVTGKSFKAAATRQQLRRARLRFAQLLIEELSRGLADASPERIEEELVDLELMPYVRDFLPPDWRTTGQLQENA